MICLKFFAHCGFPNNLIDVVSPNSRVESKFLHVRTPSSVPDSSPHLKLGYLALFRFVSMVNFMACFEAIIFINRIKRAFLVENIINSSEKEVTINEISLALDLNVKDFNKFYVGVSKP